MALASTPPQALAEFIEVCRQLPEEPFYRLNQAAPPDPGPAWVAHAVNELAKLDAGLQVLMHYGVMVAREAITDSWGECPAALMAYGMASRAILTRPYLAERTYNWMTDLFVAEPEHYAWLR